MDQITKFLRKLSPKLRAQVQEAAFAIVDNQLEGLDIKPLTGKKKWYRCRIGDIRIIFIRTQANTNIVIEVLYRGKAYRKK